MITEYKKVLSQEDKKYIGENKVQDAKGRFYEDGISQLNEEPTKELFFDQLFDDVKYEVPYLDIGVEKCDSVKTRGTKLDALVNGYQAYEYKKTHILFNNGGYNEFCLKSICGSLASQNFINPNNGQSLANQSVVGDIEKLLLLPDKYELNVVFEMWYGGGYTPEDYYLMLDLIIDKYYHTEKNITTYSDSIHPILTECDIVHYKILGRK